MVQMEIPDDKPVLLYTSYRTGSTALCDELATQLNYKNFDEVWHPEKKFQDRYNQWQQYKQDSGQYVIKLMPDQIREDNKDEVAETFHNCYKIRLVRHDFVKQIASWYLATGTDIWHQTEEQQVPTQKVPLIEEWMHKCCNRILWNNQQLTNMPDNIFDADLQFEGMQLEHTKYQPRNRVENYDDVVQFVETVLVDRGLAEKKHA